jgi:type IV pilus assembly protein PilN
MLRLGFKEFFLMSTINLLPWREELRAHKQKEFIQWIAFTVIIAAGLSFLVHTHIQGLIDYQKERNAYLVKETNILKSRVEEIKKLEEQRDQLLTHMEVIRDLQASRSEVVHLFDQIVDIVPEGVHLESISRSGKKLEVKGETESTTRLPVMMRRIESSPFLHKPDFKGTTQRGNQRVSAFEMAISQRSAEDEEESQ